MFSSKSSEETCIHIVCMDGTNISSSPFFFYISSLLFLNVLVCVFYFLPVLVSLCFLSSY